MLKYASKYAEYEHEIFVYYFIYDINNVNQKGDLTLTRFSEEIFWGGTNIFGEVQTFLGRCKHSLGQVGEVPPPCTSP